MSQSVQEKCSGFTNESLHWQGERFMLADTSSCDAVYRSNARRVVLCTRW